MPQPPPSNPLLFGLTLLAFIPCQIDARLAGAYHTCTFLPDMSVKCWGNNKFGQLGLGDWNYRGGEPYQMGDSLPSVNVGSNHSVKHISPGDSHTCVILDDDSLKCWGRNSIGQLGLGDTVHRGNTASSMGDALPRVNVGVGKRVKDISAGVDHTCAILDDGFLKCWGRNWYGQLGRGDNSTAGKYADDMGDALPIVDLGNETGYNHTVKQVSAGQFHTCAILDDDTLKCWGQNLYGQLGQGDNMTRGDEPYQMGTNLTAVDLGQDDNGRDYTAKYVTCGYYHTCVILDDDSLKCWGRNLFGEVGLGHDFVVGDEETEMGNALPKVDLGTEGVVRHVSAGHYHTCARIDPSLTEQEGNFMKCWGKNWYGQLGQGDKLSRGTRPEHMGDDLPPIDIGTDKVIKEIVAGSDHTCAILEDNSVKCWGHNLIGTLGYGDHQNRGGSPGEMGSSLGIVDVGTFEGKPYNSYPYAVAPDGENGGGLNFNFETHGVSESPSATPLQSKKKKGKVGGGKAKTKANKKKTKKRVDNTTENKTGIKKKKQAKKKGANRAGAPQDDDGTPLVNKKKKMKKKKNTANDEITTDDEDSGGLTFIEDPLATDEVISAEPNTLPPTSENTSAPQGKSKNKKKKKKMKGATNEE